MNYSSLPRALRRGSFLLSLAGALTVAKAGTLQVPSGYATIQAAINAAVNGDVVAVAPGTYHENITLLGKDIELVGTGGREVTRLIGAGLDPVVAFPFGSTVAARLSGFTITKVPQSGGPGVSVGGAAPTIDGNRIERIAGVGIDVTSGSPVIARNRIVANQTGIAVGGASAAQILDNRIDGNGPDSGIRLNAAGQPLIQGNLIAGNHAFNQGGGIWLVNQSDALIRQNVFDGNTAQQGAAIYWVVPSGVVGPVVINNTFVSNIATYDSGIFAEGFDTGAVIVNNLMVGANSLPALLCTNSFDLSPPVVRYNDIHTPGAAGYGGVCASQGGTNGNTSVAPTFANPAAGNYRLTVGSAGVDQGDNAAAQLASTDADGLGRSVDGDGNTQAVVDLGAFETRGDHPGVLALSASAISVGEGGVAEVSVTRESGSSGSVSVTAVTSDDTATAVSDYTPTLVTLSFADGESGSRSFPLPIAADVLVEGAEQLRVRLESALGGAVLSQSRDTMSVSIVDDDTLDLGVSATTSSSTVEAGQPYAYQLQVANSGNALAMGVTLELTLPPGASLQGVTPGQGSCTGSSVISCALGTVAGGGAVTVVLQIVPSLPGPMTLTAAATSLAADSNPANNVVSVNSNVTQAVRDYFPLLSNSAWTYRINGGYQYTARVVAGTTLINGVNAIAIRDDDDGHTEFYTNDAEGIRLHRTTESGVFFDCQPAVSRTLTLTFSPALRFAPAQVSVGQKEEAAGSVTVTISPPMSAPCPVGSTSTITYNSESIFTGLESVTVPAGTFAVANLQVTQMLSGTLFGEPIYEVVSTLTRLGRNVGLVSTSGDGEVTELVSVMIDPDADGLTAHLDNCPVTGNLDQRNQDQDALGDACDTDDDNDGVVDASDAFPLDAAESADFDHDAIGDNADLDDDNDGLTDAVELSSGLNPRNAADANQDADGDGLSNALEIALGTRLDRADTDGDGRPDLVELNAGTNPLINEGAVLSAIIQLLLD